MAPDISIQETYQTSGMFIFLSLIKLYRLRLVITTSFFKMNHALASHVLKTKAIFVYPDEREY